MHRRQGRLGRLWPPPSIGTSRFGRRVAVRRSTSRADERGTAAIEFAILLPILVALLSGIVSAGLGYNNVLGLAAGVRDGARFGATSVVAGGWATTVQQQTVDLTYLNAAGHPLAVSTSMVCVQLVRAPATVVQASTCSLVMAAPVTPAGVAAGTCLVKVWAQLPVVLRFLIVPSRTVQVQRQSVALYERGTC